MKMRATPIWLAVCATAAAAQLTTTSSSSSASETTRTTTPSGTPPPPRQTPRPADEDDCDCYVTNGTHPMYLQKRMFYDFRSLSDHAGVPDVMTDPDEATDAKPSSKYFRGSDWERSWELSDWTNGIARDDPLIIGEYVPRVYSPSNVYIEDNDDDDDAGGPDTHMTVRTRRLDRFQSCGEFSSRDDYQYVSLRALARTVGDPGGVTSIFTYRRADELQDIQEADIEFLTRESDRRVHYVNNPAYTLDGQNFPEATRNVTIPDGRTFSDWLVHRFDWTPDRSVWYVDGNETASIAFQVPRDPSRIVFNVWSDGGYWSGNMSVNDETFLHVQWIEMIYNTTDPDRGSCSAVCSIDHDPSTDSIMLLWDSPASRSTSFCTSGLLLVAAAAALLVTW